MAKQEQRAALASEVTRYKFTTDQYRQMSDAGILPSDERTELIEGVIVLMPAIGEDHLWNVNFVTRVFFQRFDDQAIVSIQNPVLIAPHSEPQPDIALLRQPQPGDRHKPTPEDVFLIIEVSDTTLASDRRVKMPLYAAAGIRESWIINLVERQLEVFREPADGQYRQQLVLKANDMVSPLAFPDITLKGSDLLQ